MASQSQRGKRRPAAPGRSERPGPGSAGTSTRQRDGDKRAPVTTGSSTATNTVSSGRANTGHHTQPRRAERRPEMVKQRRDERRKVYERRRRQWLITRIGLGTVGILIVGALLWTVFSYANDKSDNVRPQGVKEYSYQGSDHTGSLQEKVQYSESPPVGGRHAPAPFWQNCGYYSAPIPNEAAVHSLEHGAVWITYRPDLPQDQIDKLKKEADDNTYVLASPYQDQAEPIVLSAWNNQLRLNSLDDKRFDQFVRYFRQGPQTPERGAACTGGNGTPE